MARFLDLAPELLTQIVRELLGPVTRWRSGYGLFSTALTCRLLFKIVEPFLYTNFTHSRPAQLERFLRTILERPDYATCVKSLSLSQAGFDRFDTEGGYETDEDDEDDEDDKDSDPKMEGVELAQLIEACDNLGLTVKNKSRRDKWISSLECRNYFALSAILILSLPNLETFSMELGYSRNKSSKFLRRALYLAANPDPRLVSHPFLSNLKHVEYGCAHSETCIMTEEIASYFYLPSLRTIEVHALGCYDFTWSPPITTSKVETIKFLYAGIGYQDLGTILQSTTNLKHFSYSEGNPKYVGMELSDISAFREHLPLVKSTLETLSLIDISLCDLDKELLDFLNMFPKLKQVLAPISLLIGHANLRATAELWEMLPSGLENLQISCDSGQFVENREDMLDQIIGVVLRKQSHFKKLNNLELCPSKEILDFGALKDVCISNDVKFSLKAYYG
jgi:hypothetical protein